MPKAKSKRQARFFGAVAGGKIKKKGLTRKEARTRLRGVKVRALPTRTRKRKSTGASRRRRRR